MVQINNLAIIPQNEIASLLVCFIISSQEEIRTFCV